MANVAVLYLGHGIPRYELQLVLDAFQPVCLYQEAHALDYASPLGAQVQRILAGRSFCDTDSADSPDAVVVILPGATLAFEYALERKEHPEDRSSEEYWCLVEVFDLYGLS